MELKYIRWNIEKHINIVYQKTAFTLASSPTDSHRDFSYFSTNNYTYFQHLRLKNIFFAILKQYIRHWLVKHINFKRMQMQYSNVQWKFECYLAKKNFNVWKNIHVYALILHISKCAWLSFSMFTVKECIFFCIESVRVWLISNA